MKIEGVLFCRGALLGLQPCPLCAQGLALNHSLTLERLPVKRELYQATHPSLTRGLRGAPWHFCSTGEEAETPRGQISYLNTNRVQGRGVWLLNWTVPSGIKSSCLLSSWTAPVPNQGVRRCKRHVPAARDEESVRLWLWKSIRAAVTAPGSPVA